MARLDELVEQCRAHPPFIGATVRDTSNRPKRDWPWWSVQIERSGEENSNNIRVSATVRMNSTQAGEPGSFEGEWLARVWQDVSVDSFRAQGGWPLHWEALTPQELQDTMIALLDAATAAISDEQKHRRSQ